MKGKGPMEIFEAVLLRPRPCPQGAHLLGGSGSWAGQAQETQSGDLREQWTSSSETRISLSALVCSLWLRFRRVFIWKEWTLGLTGQRGRRAARDTTLPHDAPDLVPLLRMFRDRSMEARFAAETAGAARGHLVVGLVLHLAGVALQWRQVVQPEYNYDFAQLGSKELASGQQAMGAILSVHLALTTGLSVLLLLSLLVDMRRGAEREAHQRGGKACVIERACCGFVSLKLGHLGASLGAYACFPGDGWLVTFPAAIVFVHGWMAAIPFRCVRVALPWYIMPRLTRPSLRKRV